MREFDLLNLTFVLSHANTNDNFRLVFGHQGIIDVDRDTLIGIATWIRANRENEDYYSLLLGDVVITASRPRGNHHRKHKELLEFAGKRFYNVGDHVNIDSEIKTAPVKGFPKGMVWFKNKTDIRVVRNVAGDYVIETRKFSPLISEVTVR